MIAVYHESKVNHFTQWLRCVMWKCFRHVSIEFFPVTVHEFGLVYVRVARVKHQSRIVFGLKVTHYV